MRNGIDANIILRALLNDDPVQSESARRFLSDLASESNGYVGISALLEIFWVLRSRYKLPRDLLHDTVRELLMTNHVEFESFDSIVRALAHYREGRAEFPDALLAERNLEAGCGGTYTLDKRTAARVLSMTLLS